MPFLATASFREWEDDGKWEQVNATAFRGRSAFRRDQTAWLRRKLGCLMLFAREGAAIMWFVCLV